MLLWLSLLLIGVVAIGLAARLLAVRPLAGRPWLVALGARTTAVRASLTENLGTAGAAVAVLLAGAAATVAVCWVFGALVKLLQPNLDVPLFRFAAQRQGHRTWTTISALFTQMGNRHQVKTVSVLSAVVLPVIWRRRGWWIPPIVIAAAYGFEKYGQKLLGKVVARGHPPTTLGTYPSGGVARLIAIYGAILYLLILGRKQRPAVRRWLFTLLAVAAFVEGYTRIFLLKHWFTDVVGGWLFGTLLLGVLIAATATLASTSQPTAAVRVVVRTRSTGSTTQAGESTEAGSRGP